MSVSVTNSALTTLYQLVTYLTQPLIKVYPSQAVLQLQFYLHANLASQFLSADTSSLSPFTLLLAPSSLPPAPVYAACLQAGLVWSEWIRALGGRAFYVFVMDGHLKVRIGETGDAVTIWSAETTSNSSTSSMITNLETQSSSASASNDRDSESPMTLKLQAMLDSVRSRALPKNPTRTLPAFSCINTKDTTDDSDSDSESDTDSTTSSSLFSETSSVDTMSSVSSTTSSPILKTSILLPSTDKAIYVPRHRLTTATTTTTPPVSVSTEVADSVSRPLFSRSQRRLARATVDKAKVDTCRYTYQGGQTLVMTGGVMLGGVKNAAGNATKPMNARNNVTVARSTQAVPSKVKPQMMMMNGPDSSQNWRVRA
ncbi:hypothetical protein C8R42DRAFT_715166 [Lentinula raphanica]|nr:hypothetical protein C8R42DRAFT_715166 [Lentinula raphanica]